MSKCLISRIYKVKMSHRMMATISPHVVTINKSQKKKQQLKLQQLTFKWKFWRLRGFSIKSKLKEHRRGAKQKSSQLRKRSLRRRSRCVLARRTIGLALTRSKMTTVMSLQTSQDQRTKKQKVVARSMKMMHSWCTAIICISRENVMKSTGSWLKTFTWS
jgi:hypothetical protein